MGADVPFLEVLTRCYKRPAMLAANQASLREQTDGDWVQTLLVDDVGRGIGWSSENMGAHAPFLVGEYIWILDDDDLCICPTLVADLKSIVAEHNPDVVMVKMDHGKAVLPGPSMWGCDPEYGQIGVSAYIVRRSLWQRHAGAFSPGWYGSDYSFINSIFGNGNNPIQGWAVWMPKARIYWHDCIASRVQVQSFGKAEGDTNG
jgi:hypothetical protein